jgi:hypothetical protein
MDLDSHVAAYLSSKGDKKFSQGIPVRLIEYNKLKTMWDLFGLNKFDLEECDPKWIQEMYMVYLGIEKVKSNAMENSKNSVASNMIKGPKRVNKLL